MRRFYPLLIFFALTVFGLMAQESAYRDMLSHVEKIVVVDSITVNKADFLNAYRISPSTGRLLKGDEVLKMLQGTRLPATFKGKPSTGFTNEFNDYLVWAQPDSTGFLRIAETSRLNDGSWAEPRFASAVLNDGTIEIADEPDDDPEAASEAGERQAVWANAAFPFMADDGQTLYFASDNDRSLGGLDIFVATKDPADGSFYIPGNLGLPFNSPYDDYMMVLDNETGVGWWATDRNQLEDQITIYVYALTENRENVDPSDENLERFASLQGWQELQDDSAVALRNSLKKAVSQIRKVDTRTPEFFLLTPSGTAYRFFSDFTNSQAASLMKDYLRQQEKVDGLKNNLESLRGEYFKSAGSQALGSKISALENRLRDEEQRLSSIRSEVYRLEFPGRK